MIEKRLVEIETKIAFQEQTIKDLNDVLYQQQQEVERLGGVCDTLVNLINRLQESGSGIDAPANEKPPHY